MRRVALVLVLLLMPLVAAHVEQGDPQHNTTMHVDADLGPAASGPNDFSRVNPFVLAGQGRWGQAAGFGAMWAVLLLGVWQLVKLVIGRFVLLEEE